MALLFTPEILDLHKLCVGLKRERENTRVVAEMDKGTHSRSNGDPTYRRLTLSLSMTPIQMATFDAWMDVAENSVFYSTFPEQDFPNVESGKFYAFSFEETNPSAERASGGQYTSEIILHWHYRVAPIDRT